MQYLRFDIDSPEEAKAFRSKAAAVSHFATAARYLARFGQECTATLHYAPTRDQIAEYPDFVLTLGPRGGVNVEAA